MTCQGQETNTNEASVGSLMYTKLLGPLSQDWRNVQLQISVNPWHERSEQMPRLCSSIC